MNRDRIAGSVKQTVGSLEEIAGKALGDPEMVADGRAKKVEGKIQSAFGSLKDVLKP